MKKLEKLLYAFVVACLVLLSTGQLWAKQHSIAPTATLSSNLMALLATTEFASGDTVVLQRGGAYTWDKVANSIPVSEKGFAIVASAGAGVKPIITVKATDVFNFTQSIDDATRRYRLENLTFVSQATAYTGKYFYQSPSTAKVSIDGIWIKDCSFSIPVRGFTRFVGETVLASGIFIENTTFSSCLDNTNSAGAANVYGILHFEGALSGGVLNIKNSIFYNMTNNIVNSSKAFNSDVLIENSTFIRVNVISKATMVQLTAANPNMKITIKNTIVDGYKLYTDADLYNASNLPVLTVATQPTNLIATNAGAVYYTKNLVRNTNNALGGAVVQDNLSNLNPDVSYPNAASGDYTMTGSDVAYMKTAGDQGYCVGAYVHYPGYTPPTIADNDWIGADAAPWNVATNWQNGLPNGVGDAVIGTGKVAQSTGGNFLSHLVLKGKLLTAATEDILDKGLTLQTGAQIEGANTLSVPMGIDLQGNATVTVPNAGTLSLNAAIDGTATITKAGDGALQLIPAKQSFAGTWELTAGTLVANSIAALGQEVKVDFKGGKLQTDAELVTLPGYFKDNGTPLAIGNYDNTSGYVTGSGVIKVVDTKKFRLVAEAEVSWNDKLNWFPIHMLVPGDTGVVSGKYPKADGSGRNAYQMNTTVGGAAGITFVLADSASLRLTHTGDVSPFMGNLLLDGGFISFATSNLAKDYTLDVRGAIAVKSLSYIQSRTVSNKPDLNPNSALGDRVGHIGVFGAISGTADIKVDVSDPAYYYTVYGVDILSSNNTGFTGNWIVENNNLMAKGASCLGVNNKITLNDKARLYLDVDAATDKSQTIEAAVGAKIYTQPGHTHRLAKLVLGSTVFEALPGTTINITNTTAGAESFIEGTGIFVIGTVEPQSITITSANGQKGIKVGQTLQLKAHVVPADADNATVSWSVSGGQATIDASGLLTAVSATEDAGSVTVTAATPNGKQATYVVKTYSADKLIAGITVQGSIRATLGAKLEYVAVYTPEFVTNAEIAWSLVGDNVGFVASDMAARSDSTKAYVLTTDGATTYTIVATAKSNTTVSGSMTTTIARATKYEWVPTTGGAWHMPECWNPQATIKAGDTAIVRKHATEMRFHIGEGGGVDSLHRIFPSKLFLMNEAQCRLSRIDDNSSNLNPFTSLEGNYPADCYNEADIYLQGGTVGTWTVSPKTIGFKGSLTVLDSSFLYIGASSVNAAWYLEAEIKGTAPLVLIGNEATMGNVPGSATAQVYSESTFMIKNSNPSYTGTWYLKLANVYAKHVDAMGKNNTINVGRGRKLIIDLAEAVNSSSTLILAAKSGAEPAGMVSTRKTANVTIKVRKLVLGGVSMPTGYYNRNSVGYQDYFENSYVTIQVGDVASTPAESITLSGPTEVALGESFAIGAVVHPASALPTVTWSIDPATLASIDATGLVTAGYTNGCITITATATDGSGVKGTHKVAIGSGSCSGGTGVLDIPRPIVTIAPNPTSDLLNIYSGEHVITKLTVYTATGVLVKQLIVGKTSTLSMNVSDLSSGSYFAVLVIADYPVPVTCLFVKE